MDRGRSHESIKPKNTRNRWETKVWRRTEDWRKCFILVLRNHRFPSSDSSSSFYKRWTLSLSNQRVSEKLLLLSACRSHLPTCHLLIQANLKCQISQISSLAFKLTNSGSIIGIFNFIPIGPLYFQSYKYISGFL